jgi:hypothetical protein
VKVAAGAPAIRRTCGQCARGSNGRDAGTIPPLSLHVGTLHLMRRPDLRAAASQFCRTSASEQSVVRWRLYKNQFKGLRARSPGVLSDARAVQDALQGIVHVRWLHTVGRKT